MGGKGHSGKSPQNGGFSDGRGDLSDPSDPKNGMNDQNGSHEEPNPESGSLRSLGSLEPRDHAGGAKRLTEEEAREVQKRISEGMKPEIARREVLRRKGGP